ncbi:MAG: ROK family protein [Actinomycetota bacterium]|nr:ROK family protein [Actinomycetota bacterium]
MRGPTIGVDIGGTKILGVRLGPDHLPEAQVKVSTPGDGRRAVEVVGQVIAALAVVPAVSGADDTAPSAVGVGIPGLVDGHDVLRFSPHLPDLVGFGLSEHLLVEHAGARRWFGNDATAAGWAEHLLGAATDADEVVMVTLGTGIGGGLIHGGRLAEGANRFAGEFGHMVVDPYGPLCPCGKQGCWERYASGSGLGLLGREAAMAGQAGRVIDLAGGDPEAVRGEHVTLAAAEGDLAAVAIMGRFAWWLALGLANLANILDPAVIVVGGGLIDAGEVLMDPVRRAFANLVEAGEQRGGVAIRSAALGSRAGAVGAALLAERVTPD